MIQYTDVFEDLDSSLVEEVYYDKSTDAAYVSLNGEVYQYHNVPFDEVKALVSAGSIGRAFNGSALRFEKGFKQKFGPGTYLGYRSDLVFGLRNYVATASTSTFAPGGYVTAPSSSNNPGGGKNLTYSATAVVDGKPVSEKRVPLKVDVDETNAALNATKPKGTYTVHFESDYNGSKTYTTETVSVDAAVAELNDVTKRLGLSVKVTGVFVHLG